MRHEDKKTHENRLYPLYTYPHSNSNYYLIISVVANMMMMCTHNKLNCYKAFKMKMFISDHQQVALNLYTVYIFTYIKYFYFITHSRVLIHTEIYLQYTKNTKLNKIKKTYNRIA